MVDLTGSSGRMRPFESIKCDAKMVLISVDFPRPVWPAPNGQHSPHGGIYSPTNTDDIELKASLQQFLLDLLGNAVETNVASWEHSVPLRHRHGHGCDSERDRIQRMTSLLTERSIG